MSTSNIPKDYRAATPYVIVNNGSRALEFYTKAFSAKELVRLADPSGKVMHAEMEIGSAKFMLADEFPEMGYTSPMSLGGSSVSVLVYFEDVDAAFAQAVTAGATSVMPPSDQFDGDRRGTLKDPFGHVWLVASRKETISTEELKKRFSEMMAGGSE
jgi:PhnB protein